MINQQLVDYVKQQMQAGVAKDAVRKALGDAGWPPADIDDSMKAAEPAGANPVVGSAAQTTINPSVAMGGVDVTKTAAASSGDKFFAKPSANLSKVAMDEDDDHPQVKKFVVSMIVMGAVILLLAGSLAFVYFNLNSQLDAAQGGGSGQVVSLQQQISQLNTEKKTLDDQVKALGSDNQELMAELSFFVPAASASSTASVSAIIKGILSGNASTTFSLMTAHGVKVLVANSKDEKVSAALTPLSGTTTTITLAGTHPAGSVNLTVTAVNGSPL